MTAGRHPAILSLATLAILALACSGTTGVPAAPGTEAQPAADATVPGSGELDATPDRLSTQLDDASADAPVDVPLNDAASLSDAAFCKLPGSVIWTSTGPTVVPGGDASLPDMTWMQVPPGFCVHYFAQVNHVRQLRFAPGGDLFAASPSTSTAGGAALPGLGEVLVLPDDDQDGLSDAPVVFFPSAAAGQPTISSTEGLMFANGYFYYQDVDTGTGNPTIRRVAFQAGDRAPSATAETVTTFSPTAIPQSADHWPKTIDIAQDGTIYVTNGSDQDQVCYSPSSPNSVPFGAIFKINSDGSLSEVARGFRNPITLRCEPNHDVCFAIELALDGSEGIGREKIVPVRQGDDWGFPCCATTNLPYSGAYYHDTSATPDCSGVTPESVSFVVGDTPFGIDFETGRWPAPWTNRAFAVLHGVVGTWAGARVVGVALDPTSGNLLQASDIPDVGLPGDMLDFATGWFDDTTDMLTNHGRPAAIAFAPDGRMFVGDDWSGVVAWIAPVNLTP